MDNDWIKAMGLLFVGSWITMILVGGLLQKNKRAVCIQEECLTPVQVLTLNSQREAKIDSLNYSKISKEQKERLSVEIENLNNKLK